MLTARERSSRPDAWLTIRSPARKHSPNPAPTTAAAAKNLGRELGRLEELRGAGLKAAEDLADAHVCAYVGLWWWAHGPAATLVAGDDGTGAILVPRPPG